MIGKKKIPGAWNAAYVNGWIDECREHMIRLRNHKKSWTKQECFEDANKYKTKSEWFTKSNSAYTYAYRFGWLNYCCSNMDDTLTIEKCIAKAQTYKTKKSWIVKSKSSYEFAKKNRIVKLCSAHMVEYKPYTIKDCKYHAKRFSTKTEWAKGHSGTYYAAWHKGWISDCCKHMK